MARPRKWNNDAERRNAQSDRRRKERQSKNAEFTCVDGEGIGQWRHHKYVLLGVGQEQIENPAGLQFPEIMEFLWEQYQALPGHTFAGFFLGYDFTQWFRTLPRERAEMLLTKDGMKRRQRKIHGELGPFPVSYEGWEFDILGMKRFKLRKEHEQGWMYVCDSGSFFQASLMSVIDPKKWSEPVVSEDEYATLEVGKGLRDSAALDSGMRAYNRLENTVLARLLHRTDVGFREAGIRLKKNQWFGPGQAAQAWLTQVKAPTGEDIRASISRHGPNGIHRSGEHWNVQGGSQPETSILDAGRMSYYGGWFEIFAHGHVPGNTWEYDINSAYPYIISRLPCLEHGQWNYRNGVDAGMRDRSNLTLEHANIVGSNPRIGTMLHRCPDHSIRRPHRTAGWYWRHELDAAVACGLIDDMQILESWEYEGCDCPPPLRGIAGLYGQRLKVGKNSPQGKGLRLVYNSVYGKIAQSVGNPKYGNSFYASLITAGTRTMILDAIRTHPEGTYAVVMVATDGVYFTSPHPDLEVSEKLGTWSESDHGNLTLFKPGVYWDDSTRERIADGRDPAFKARGISAKAFAGRLRTIDDHFSQWPQQFPGERDPAGPRKGWYPRIEFTSGFSMVTCQQALQRRKWQLAGTLGHSPIEDGCPGCSGAHLVQDADPITKRHSGYYEGGIYWSRPFKDGGYEKESTPYDRMFGQPDHEEFGINDDGNVKDQWARMFR